MIFFSGALHRLSFFHAMVAVFASSCAPLWAQGHANHQSAPASAPDESALLDRWRKSNEAVGQFPRGHADVLLWEQTHLPQAPAAASTATGGLTRARAVELALRDAPALLERPGLNRLERAELERRVRQQSLELERAWVDAVVAAQILEQARQAAETAEIGADLAQRMLSVGHWSRARQMQEELPLWQARARLSQAQWSHSQALQKLWQHLGGFFSREQLQSQLPMQWTEAPPAVSLDLLGARAQALQAHPRWSLEQAHAQLRLAALSPDQLAVGRQIIERSVAARSGQEPAQIGWRAGLTHAQIEALQAQTSADRLKRQIEADVLLAQEAFKAATEQATQAQSQVLRLASASEQETLWRYNGMLASTWQLLASARSRIEAVEAVLVARRQAWHAYLDLQAVLAGLPYTGALVTVSSGNAAKGGH
jgi:hypothetical protein